MKTYSKVLYEKQYGCYPCWECVDKSIKIESYIKYKVHFDFEEGLRFSISIPNVTYCTKNPISCIFRILEHENMGTMKYQRLKERVREIDCWRKL